MGQAACNAVSLAAYDTARLSDALTQGVTLHSKVSFFGSYRSVHCGAAVLAPEQVVKGHCGAGYRLR